MGKTLQLKEKSAKNRYKLTFPETPPAPTFAA